MLCYVVYYTVSVRYVARCCDVLCYVVLFIAFIADLNFNFLIFIGQKLTAEY